ncbi:MAG: PorT family protein [Cytophagales bacterium]|nr:MAG: PorT family protein [Cytophagales bacterium]TAH28935.1 MAG: PorT family protein [Cytophagales bacterium]
MGYKTIYFTNQTIFQFLVCFQCLFLCNYSSVSAQTDCKEAIKRAEQAYQEGLLNQVKNILSEECINQLTKKEDKTQAYYLIVLSNLYLNEKGDAKNAMLQLLSLEPEYMYETTSPIEFQKFYDTFKVKPTIVVGIKGGINMSQIQSLKAFSVDDTKNSNNGKYDSKIGIQLQIAAILPITNRIDIMAEIGYKRFGYQFSNKLFDFQSIKFVETQAFLEVPLMLKFNFGNNYNFKKNRKKFLNKLNPYIFAGASATYLLSSTAIATRIDTGGETPLTLESQSLDMKPQRNTLGYYGIGGLGVDYKSGRSFLTFEMRYHYGFQNIIKTDERYSNQQLPLTYGYVDSDIAFRNLTINVGYFYPFYKARQKKLN